MTNERFIENRNNLEQVHEEALWFNDEEYPNSGWHYEIDDVHELALEENESWELVDNFNGAYEPEDVPRGSHVISREEILGHTNLSRKGIDPGT